MKKCIFFFLAAICAVGMQAKTIYLNAGGDKLWDQGGAVFFAHSWKGTDSNIKDVKMGLVTAGVYSVDVPDENPNIIFVRMPSGSESLNWDTKWNQTADLTIPTEKDCYTIDGWGEGEGAKSTGKWSKYDGPTTMEYYLAGEKFPNASWDAGKHLKMTDGEISFKDLAADTYKFKITNNTWSYSLGYSAVSASCSTADAYGTDSEGNVCITLLSVGDIAIKVSNGLICVTVNGETKKPGGMGVPSECGDVMMQGFYWDSYKVDDKDAGTNLYGDTRWKSLLGKADEIGAYFDLIWLPPSALAGGTGYYPRQYSNQNSDWGSRSDLEKLIAIFHNNGTRVVADVVLDHMIAMSGWCEFGTMDFGKYGKFTPEMSWICKGDEINTEKDPAQIKEMGDCYGKATGPDDDGDNNVGARDFAHQKKEVQDFSKAYLKWLLDEMKYDGFRWDEAKGFDPAHIGDYNGEAQPYISFVERWSGTDDIMWTIDRTGKRTMALDFQTKYSAFDGISGWNYEACKGSGLLGAGYAKYAVTFIDSHDWFMRNDQEFGGQGKSMTGELKDRLLQANAFLLSMPGVPSVFYPHWAKYKEEIKPLINARHLAGVHSESEVSNESADKDGYQCTVKGKNGWLILQLGNRATKTAWDSSYKLAASGNGYSVWVNATGDAAPGIIATPSTTFEDKENGIKVTIKAVGGSGNAKIYYTVDGSDPTTSSAQYSAPLVFKETTTLKVMAACGSAQSRIQTYTYTYREPLQRGIRVRFNKPEEWSKVYFYAWKPGTDGQGNPTSENVMGAYPGQRVYQDVEGWYSYEFDPELKTVNFCINSGDDCGGVNVRSNDLEISYDACYKWREGKETESNEEELADCDTNLNPAFDLVIAPESGFFRDQNEGLQVNMNTVGSETAVIYYTTDGSEPTADSQNSPGTVSFTIKQTTTVKAFAQNGADRTPVYTATYTYKAPQQGAITVKFIKPEEWEDLYLYAFTRVKVGNQYKDTPYALDGKNSKWPGMKWTQTDGQWHTHTMKDEIKEIYVIFTEGDKKPQTQDLFLDENTCYLWNPDCWKAVKDSNCDGQRDEAVEQVGAELPVLNLTEPMYNILGQRVDASYNGIIIQNGHKFLLQ